MQYLDVLTTTGTGSTGGLEPAIEAAITACGGVSATTCPSPTCVVSNIAEGEYPGLGDSQIASMVASFLQEALGLSADEANVLNDPSNHGFTMEVFNEYTCQMQQFCLSGVGADEQKMMMCSGGPVLTCGDNDNLGLVMGDALGDLIGSDSTLGLEGLNDNLDSFDNISEDQSFKDCAALKYVYDELKNMNNLGWCITFGNFEFRPFANVNIQVGGNNFTPNPFVQDPERNGVAGLNNNGELTVAFNPNLCNCDENTDLINRAKTVLHEGIHAEIWQYVADNLPPGETLNNIGSTSFIQTFYRLFELTCTVTSNSDQHNVMLDNSVNFLAEMLHDFNGGIGEPNDYLWLAYNGIWMPGDPCSQSILSQAQINNLNLDYNNNVTPRNDLQCP